MSRWAFALGLGVVACGAGGPAGSKAPRSTVEVPEAKPAAGPERPGSAPTGALALASSSLGECVTELRRASDLPADGEQRSLYDQALAAEERGALPEARKLYFEVVSKYPSSRLVPLAYLAFGELFAREAVADPSKRDLAIAAYGEVVKYPPPDNIAYAYGLLRLGDSERERGDQQALALYKKALDAVQQHATLPCAEAVKQGAEDGLVETYVRVGQPERAWSFFRMTAGDARANALLADLAARYKKAGKAADACAAVRGAGAGASPDLARSFCP